MRVWKPPTAIICLREATRVFWLVTCIRMVKANVRMRVYACAKLKGKSNSLSYLDYGSPTKVSP